MSGYKSSFTRANAGANVKSHSALLVARTSGKVRIDGEMPADTLAGLEFPPFEEQLTTKWLGDSKTTEQAAITKAMMDVGIFLVELGDVRQRDLPKSFGPYNNMTFMESVVRGD